MKKIYCLWCVVFLLLIMGACPLAIIMKDRLDNNSYENRSRAEFPKLTDMEKFPEAFERWFNDNLPFRNELIQTGSRIEYDVFNRAMKGSVLKGKENWLYYINTIDGDPLSDYTGRNIFGEEELKKAAAELLEKKERLAVKGCEFVLFIAPGKERIYPEYMPEWAGAPSKEYPTEQLIEYLRTNTDIKVVSAYEDLYREKESCGRNLYYRLDTHWNFLGGYIGSKTLLSALEVGLPEIKELDITETEPTVCDLADLLNLRNYLNTDPDIKVSGYGIDGLVSDIHEQTGVFLYHNNQAADKRKLFMVRDSFADAMAEFVASRFSESMMVHSSSYTDGIEEAFEPDVFVLELAERRIRNLWE